MAKNGLTKQQVEHVAKLANLPLNTSEIKTFQKQLSEVVKYVQKIEEVHSAQGLPAQAGIVHRSTEGKVGREDVVRADKCLSQEDVLSGTENKHNGLFIVPAIFEE